MDGDGEEASQTGNCEKIEEEECREIGVEETDCPQEQSSDDLVGELIGMINYVSSLNDYRRTQRKECFGLLRRLKLILPVLEEIGELERLLPDEGVAFLLSLRKALGLAKRLLRTCNEGSKIYLAHDSEVISVRFNCVYERIGQALEGLPHEVLGISDEMKEQAQLTCKQLRRAKRQTDTQDIEFVMDIMVVFSDKDEGNADIAILERLASRLDLRTPDELQVETIAIKKLIKQRGGQNAESTQKILDVLKKFKKIVGVEENDVLDDAVESKETEETPSMSIPKEFLCPISSEIMIDPVIVATGQIYDRESIQKWLEWNNATCPKSGQPLADTSLTLNSDLKTQMTEWCEKNSFQLPQKEVPPQPNEPLTEQQKEILSLVQDLSSSHLKVQRKAAKDPFAVQGESGK